MHVGLPYFNILSDIAIYNIRLKIHMHAGKPNKVAIARDMLHLAISTNDQLECLKLLVRNAAVTIVSYKHCMHACIIL